MIMFVIHLNYFKSNGEQETKEIVRKTKKGLINAIKKFDEKFEIYRVASISFNLSNDKEFNDYIDTIGWKF